MTPVKATLSFLDDLVKEYPGQNGSDYVFRMIDLLKKKKDLDATDDDGMSLLHLSTFTQAYALDTIRYIATSRPNLIRTKDKLGRQPLHCALIGHDGYTQYNSFENLNIDVNAQDNDGATPLHYSIKYNNNYKFGDLVVKFCVNKGAKVNAQDNLGRTPLHYTQIYNCFHEIHKYLVSKGAKINAQDIYGKTCGHYALEFSDLVSLEELIVLGLDIKIQDNEGLTVIDYVKQNEKYNYYGFGPNYYIKEILKRYVDAQSVFNMERYRKKLEKKQGKYFKELCSKYLGREYI